MAHDRRMKTTHEDPHHRCYPRRSSGGRNRYRRSRRGDESEPAISGPALEKASTAALAHAGGGRVTDTEVGDEDSYYEVEVTRDDGSQVDVQLDEGFHIVESRPDSDTTEDSDAGDHD
jgi:hypothetical protein